MSCSGKKYKISKSKKNNKRNLRGGSPASDLVNQASLGPAVRNDFVSSPRVRDGPNADNFGEQSGGSEQSKLVMDQLGDIVTTKKYPLGYNVKANMDSLKLYQPSGGSRKNKKKNNKKNKTNKTNKNLRNTKNNKGKKSRKYNKSNNSKNANHSKKNNIRKNRNKNKNMKGGGSDWISSQYSLGSYNGPEMSASAVGQFSQAMAGSRADYMNPPNLGSAGSGYPMGSLEGANVHMTGAPLV